MLQRAQAFPDTIRLCTYKCLSDRTYIYDVQQILATLPNLVKCHVLLDVPP
jgi:hypothetical protein